MIAGAFCAGAEAMSETSLARYAATRFVSCVSGWLIVRCVNCGALAAVDTGLAFVNWTTTREKHEVYAMMSSSTNSFPHASANSQQTSLLATKTDFILSQHIQGPAILILLVTHMRPPPYHRSLLPYHIHIHIFQSPHSPTSPHLDPLYHSKSAFFLHITFSVRKPTRTLSHFLPAN